MVILAGCGHVWTFPPVYTREIRDFLRLPPHNLDNVRGLDSAFLSNIFRRGGEREEICFALPIIFSRAAGRGGPTFHIYIPPKQPCPVLPPRACGVDPEAIIMPVEKRPYNLALGSRYRPRSHTMVSYTHTTRLRQQQAAELKL